MRQGLKTFIVAVWVIVAVSSTLVTSAATQQSPPTTEKRTTTKKTSTKKAAPKPKPKKRYVCETKAVGKRKRKVCRWEIIPETSSQPTLTVVQSLPGPQLSICPSWTATLCRIVPGITIMDGAEGGAGSSPSSGSSTGSAGSGSTTGGSAGGSGSGTTTTAPSSTSSAVDPTVPCVSNPNPELTADITDLGLITYIVPPGIATGNEIKPHTFLGIDTTKTERVPIYVPSEVDLVTGSYALNNDQADYGLTFQVSCEVWFNFAHITDPIDEIKQLLPSTPGTTSQTAGPFNPILRLSAGQLIGYTTGTKQTRNWDFGLYNSTSVNQFVNMERYQNSNKRRNSVCPYNLYPSGKRASYEAKYGDFSVVSGASCRSAMQDRSGTLAGAWFNTPVSQGTEVSGRFALMTTLNSAYVRIAGLGQAMFVGSGNPTFKKPEEVTMEHCYKDGERYLFFKLVSATEVRVVDSTGACPASFPESGFSTYNR